MVAPAEAADRIPVGSPRTGESYLEQPFTGVVGEGVGAAGVDAHHRDAAVAGVVCLRDGGAMLALRLRPGQVRTLANGLGGIVAAVD